MKILGTVVAFAIVASMAGCASKTVKRDPYAEAAKRKKRRNRAADQSNRFAEPSSRRGVP